MSTHGRVKAGRVKAGRVKAWDAASRVHVDLRMAISVPAIHVRNGVSEGFHP